MLERQRASKTGVITQMSDKGTVARGLVGPARFYTSGMCVLSAVKAGSVFFGRICTSVRTPLRAHLSLSNYLTA